MANRKVSLATGEHYHIYNRGVDKRIIFVDKYDIQRFLKSMVEFNAVDPIGSLYLSSLSQLRGETPQFSKKLVNVIAYCLNPNHFHLILEQLVDGGISEYMKRLAGGYTGFFNQKYERSGSLFQGVFKDAHIDSDEYLLHASAYVNLNDRVHQLIGKHTKLTESLSSWEEYSDGNVKGICEKKIILGQFRNVNEYKEFATSSIESIINRKNELKDFNKLLLEQIS